MKGKKACPLAGRIKKIMQADEEVGKIAQATPVMLAKAMEMFLQRLCEKAVSVAQSRQAKTVSTSHLKHCVACEETLDFLKDTVARAPDLAPEDEETAKANKRRRHSAPPTAMEGEGEQAEGAAPKRSRGRQRKTDNATSADAAEAEMADRSDSMAIDLPVSPTAKRGRSRTSKTATVTLTQPATDAGDMADVGMNMDVGLAMNRQASVNASKTLSAAQHMQGLVAPNLPPVLQEQLPTALQITTSLPMNATQHIQEFGSAMDIAVTKFEGEQQCGNWKPVIKSEPGALQQPYEGPSSPTGNQGNGFSNSSRLVKAEPAMDSKHAVGVSNMPGVSVKREKSISSLRSSHPFAIRKPVSKKPSITMTADQPEAKQQPLASPGTDISLPVTAEIPVQVSLPAQATVLAPSTSIPAQKQADVSSCQHGLNQGPAGAMAVPSSLTVPAALPAPVLPELPATANLAHLSVHSAQDFDDDYDDL